MQISELVVSRLISRLSLSHVSISFGTCMVQLCAAILFIVWYFSSLTKYGHISMPELFSLAIGINDPGKG